MTSQKNVCVGGHTRHSYWPFSAHFKRVMSIVYGFNSMKSLGFLRSFIITAKGRSRFTFTIRFFAHTIHRHFKRKLISTFVFPGLIRFIQDAWK